MPSRWPDAAAAVDGVLTGPSADGSDVEPVAAGPANVGEKVPRLDEVQRPRSGSALGRQSRRPPIPGRDQQAHH